MFSKDISLKEDFGKLTNQIRNDPSKKCSIKAPPTYEETEFTYYYFMEIFNQGYK